MVVDKVVELIGASNKRCEDAMQQIVKDEYASIRRVTGDDIVHQTAGAEDGRITEYPATAHAPFPRRAER